MLAVEIKNICHAITECLFLTTKKCVQEQNPCENQNKLTHCCRNTKYNKLYF